MTIFIVGGSGFIGTRLVKRLKDSGEQDLKIIDKNMSKHYPDLCYLSDVRCIKDLERYITNNSVLINLAAEHQDDVLPQTLYHEVNVVGAENICRIANEKDIKKIIFTSSVAVYGFAPSNTSEKGSINPFNLYGKSKYEAEKVFIKWQSQSPEIRSLVIIRPTVVFGEQNRGNVYNLFKQIAKKNFIMVGDGNNQKSIAYVENVAAFIQFGMRFKPGIHIYNYVDKPDFTMNDLVVKINRILSRNYRPKLKIPFKIAYLIGIVFDFVAFIFHKKFTISSIRVKKFCTNSTYSSSHMPTDFLPPVSIEPALEKTLYHEFIDSNLFSRE